MTIYSSEMASDILKNHPPIENLKVSNRNYNISATDRMCVFLSLREKGPNMELFLVRFFLYSVQIQGNTDQK